MVRVVCLLATGRACRPRARGDGPSCAARSWTGPGSAPRTRGWSHARPCRTAHRPVGPAHAGMVPSRTSARLHPRRRPRARGDGPYYYGGGLAVGPSAPRTRGWSHRRAAGRQQAPVGPAHAGMVPSPGSWAAAGAGRPRARGDGPPRPRQESPGQWSAPRTRGWSVQMDFSVTVSVVGPAHAGMVPWPDMTAAAGAGRPRARGDGPIAYETLRAMRASAPRSGDGPSRTLRTVWRAWGGPAHVGMVPSSGGGWSTRAGRPRVCGHGPVTAYS